MQLKLQLSTFSACTAISSVHAVLQVFIVPVSAKKYMHFSPLMLQSFWGGHLDCQVAKLRTVLGNAYLA